MDCRKMEQLISLYMDGELNQAEIAAVSSHLASCATCGREYEAMLRISVACGHIGDCLVPAPAGFMEAVMQRVNHESKVITPGRYSNWLNRSWKLSAAGVAAAVMLAISTLSINTGPIVQIAENPPAVIQPYPGSPTVSNPSNNDTTADPSGSQPGAGGQDNVNTSIPVNVAAGDPPDNAPVFLNKDRYITTTLLQVKVKDSAAAVERANKLAAAVPAQIQNLGQQVNATGAYTVLKITVTRSTADGLITQLSSLGTVTGQEVSKQDISTSYAETLSQYQALITQRATLQNYDQKEALDQRITALHSELQDWEQKAELETILLWLEK